MECRGQCIIGWIFKVVDVLHTYREMFVVIEDQKYVQQNICDIQENNDEMGVACVVILPTPPLFPVPFPKYPPLKQLP